MAKHAAYLNTSSFLKSPSLLYRPGNVALWGSAELETACQAAGSAATASVMPANAGSIERRCSCSQEASSSHAEAGFGRGLTEPVAVHNGKAARQQQHEGVDAHLQTCSACELKPSYIPRPPVSKNIHSSGASCPCDPRMRAARRKANKSLSFSNKDLQPQHGTAQCRRVQPCEAPRASKVNVQCCHSVPPGWALIWALYNDCLSLRVQ